MILCDTNILIDLFKGKPEVVASLRQIGSSELAISSITRAELYHGAFNKAELKKIKQHLDQLTELPVTESVSAQFTQLMETYSLSHRLSLPDALIAATAIEASIELYTQNLRDFRFISSLSLHTP